MKIRIRPTSVFAPIIAVLIVFIMSNTGIDVSTAEPLVEEDFTVVVLEDEIADMNYLVQKFDTDDFGHPITYDETDGRYELAAGEGILVLGTLVIQDEVVSLNTEILVSGELVAERTSFVPLVEGEIWTGIRVNDARATISDCAIENAEVGVDGYIATLDIIDSSFSNCDIGVQVERSTNVNILSNDFVDCANGVVCTDNPLIEPVIDPDLTPTLQFSTSTPSQDDDVLISIEVKNLGITYNDDTSPVSIKLYETTGGDSLITEFTDDRIIAGSASRFSYTYSTTSLSGVRYFKVVVDEAGSITEEDETNNEATGSFQIVSPPEVTLTIQNTPPVYTGEDVDFLVEFSDGDGEVSSLFIEYSDGEDDTYNPTTGETSHTFTRSFSEVDTYTITVTATDDTSQIDTDTASLTIYNQDPTVTGISVEPQTIYYTLQNYEYSADVIDPDSDEFTYYWNFGGDEVTSTYVPYYYGFAEDGTWSISVYVEDGAGGTSNTFTDTILIENQNPFSEGTIQSLQTGEYPTTAEIGETIRFEGAAYDYDGTIEGYLWDFGDGQTSNLQTIERHYTTEGTFTPSLTVTDNDGGTDLMIFPAITIGGSPPICDITIDGYMEPIEVDVGETLQFRSNAYDPDPTGYITSYEWNFGEEPLPHYDMDPQWAYSTPGTYMVTLTVQDNSGDNGFDSLEVIVGSPAVTVEIDAEPPEATIGYSITLTGIVHGDTSNIIAYMWDMDDDGNYEINFPFNIPMQHSFNTPGVHTVHFQVMFTDMTTASDSFDITISGGIVIHGTVYTDAPPNTPVQDCTLILTGDFHSDEVITGPDGTYEFVIPYEGALYSLFTVCQDYKEHYAQWTNVVYGMDIEHDIYLESDVQVFPAIDGHQQRYNIPPNGATTEVFVETTGSYDPHGSQLVSYAFSLNENPYYAEDSLLYPDGSFDGATNIIVDSSFDGIVHNILVEVTTDTGQTGIALIEVFVTNEPNPPSSRAAPKYNIDFTLTEDGTIPITDVKCIIHKENGKASGRDWTDDDGVANFNKKAGTYSIRVRYYKYDFWTEQFEVTEDTSISLQISHTDYVVSVEASGYPIVNRKVKVFNSDGKSVRLYDFSDTDGEVTFHLPDDTSFNTFDGFNFRARLKQIDYWSGLSTGGNVLIDIPTTDRTVTVTAHEPVANLPVYVYNNKNSFTGITGFTDATGVATLPVPPGNFKFKVDYLGHTFSSPKTEGDATININSQARTVTVTVAGQIGPEFTVYLDNDLNEYTGLSKDTTNGQVTFQLPKNKGYYFRAEYGGQTETSALSTGGDSTIDFSGTTYTVYTQFDGGDISVVVKAYEGTTLVGTGTSSSGSVDFQLPLGTYEYEFNYLGHDWSSGQTNQLDVTIDVPARDLAILVQSGTDHLEGIPLYLCSQATGHTVLMDLGDSLSDGTLSARIPDGVVYTIFADYLDGTYVDIDGDDTSVTIDIDVREVTVTVTSNNALAGALVTVSYGGSPVDEDVTAADGTVKFILTSGTTYTFETTYLGVTETVSSAEISVDLAFAYTDVDVTIEGDGIALSGYEVIAIQGTAVVLTPVTTTGTPPVATFVDIPVDAELSFIVSYYEAEYSTGSSAVVADDARTISIDHADVDVDLIFAGAGLDGQEIFVYHPDGTLITDAGTQTTDADGLATFSLPVNREYVFKTTYLTYSYETEPIMGDVEFTIANGYFIARAFYGSIPFTGTLTLLASDGTSTGLTVDTDAEGKTEAIAIPTASIFKLEMVYSVAETFYSDVFSVSQGETEVVHIGHLGDLYVSSISVSSSLVQPDSDVTITYTISSIGEASISQSDVRLFYNSPSNIIETRTISGLDTNPIQTFTLTWKVAGHHSHYIVYASVDHDDAIAEIDESNNVGSVAIDTMGLVIADNTFTGGDHAIKVTDSCVYIAVNEISNMQLSGIWLDGNGPEDTQASIEGNKISSCPLGVEVYSYYSVIITKNEMDDIETSVYSDASGMVASENIISNTNIAFDTISSTVIIDSNSILSTEFSFNIASSSGSISGNSIEIVSGAAFNMIDSPLSINDNSVQLVTGEFTDEFADNSQIETLHSLDLEEGLLHLSENRVAEYFDPISEAWVFTGQNGYNEVIENGFGDDSDNDLNIGLSPMVGMPSDWSAFYPSLYYGTLESAEFKTRIRGTTITPIVTKNEFRITIEDPMGIDSYTIVYSFVPYNTDIYPNLVEPEFVSSNPMHYPPTIMGWQSRVHHLLDDNTVYYFPLQGLDTITIQTDDMQQWVTSHFLLFPGSQGFVGNWIISVEMILSSIDGSGVATQICDHLILGREYQTYGSVTSVPFIIEDNQQWNELTIDAYLPDGSTMCTSVLEGDEYGIFLPLSGYECVTGTTIDLDLLVGREVKIYVEVFSNGIATPLIYGYKLTYSAQGETIAFNIDGGNVVTIDDNQIDHSFSKMLTANNDAVVYWIDTPCAGTTMDVMGINTAVHVKWSLQVNLRSQSGNAVPGRDITISDASGPLGIVTTDIDGLSDTMVVEEMVLEAGSYDYSTPHTISIASKNDIHLMIRDTTLLDLTESDDSDFDGILDIDESSDDVLWTNPSEYLLGSGNLDGSLIPNEQGVILDYNFPAYSNGYYALAFKAVPYSETIESIDINVVDAAGISVLSDSFLISHMNERYISSNFPIMTDDDMQITITSGSNGDVRLEDMCLIHIAATDGSIVVDPGQITNALEMDTDGDGIEDGLEERDDTYWYEAENYATGIESILDDEYASNSKAVCGATGETSILTIPVSLTSGEYRVHVRGGHREDPLLDDFSSGSLSSMWINMGGVSVQNENMVLSGSQAQVRCNSISSGILSFDYKLNDLDDPDYSFSLGIGPDQIDIGGLLNLDEVPEDQWHRIMIENKDGSLNLFHSTPTGGRKLIINDDEVSSPYVLDIYFDGRNTETVSFDNFYGYETDISGVSVTLGLEIDVDGGDDIVIDSSALTYDSVSYSWKETIGFSIDSEISGTLVIDNPSPDSLYLDKIGIVNLDSIYVSDVIGSGIVTDGGSYQDPIPSGVVTKAAMEIITDSITPVALYDLTATGHEDDSIASIAIDDGTIVYEVRDGPSNYDMYYIDVDNLWDTPLSPTLYISDSPSEMNPAIFSSVLAFESGNQIYVDDITTTAIANPIPGSSNQQLVGINEDIVVTLDGTTLNFYDVDNNNDGVLNYEDKEGLLDSDDDGDNTLNEELMNGINDDSDYYLDVGGRAGYFDPGMDKVYYDNDNDGLLTTDTMLDIILYDGGTIPPANGETILDLTDTTGLLVADNPTLGTIGVYEPQYDGIWSETLLDDVYRSVNGDMMIMDPQGLITDGTAGVPLSKLDYYGLSYFESGIYDEGFDLDDYLIYEFSPGHTFSMQPDTYLGGGDGSPSNAYGAFLLPLIDEDVQYLDPVIYSYSGVTGIPVIENSRIIFKAASTGTVKLLDMSYVASIHNSNVYVSAGPSIMGARDAYVRDLQYYDVVSGTYKSMVSTTDVQLSGERIVVDIGGVDSIYHMNNMDLNGQPLPGISYNDIVDICSDRVLFVSGGELYVSLEGRSISPIHIGTSTTGLIDDDVVIFIDGSGLNVYRNDVRLDIGSDGSVDWRTNSIIFEDRWIADFSDDFNTNGLNSFDVTFTSESSSVLTIKDVDLQVEYLCDPLAQDTDQDELSDGGEYQGLFGLKVVEFEDSIDFKEWVDPIVEQKRTDSGMWGSTTSEYQFEYDEVPFMHQTGVTLTTSKDLVDSEGVRDSWIQVPITTGGDSGLHRLKLNPEQRQDSVTVQTINPKVHVAKGEEFSSIDRFIVEDVVLDADTITYLQEVIREIITIRLVDRDNREVSELNKDISVSIVDVQIDRSDMHKTGETTFNQKRKAMISVDIGFTADYYLVQRNEYSQYIGLDLCIIPDNLNMANPSAVDVPESTRKLFDEICMVRILNLDRMRLESQGLDPFSDDTDNDGLLDKYENSRHYYPKNVDADSDGLSDFEEVFIYNTDPEYRDSDYDGIRDGVELGIASTEITGDISSTGSWTERLARWGNPYDLRPIDNFDADPSTQTSPWVKDSDGDGLPDGWIDGWMYLPNDIDINSLKSYDQLKQFYKNTPAWQYDEVFWKQSGQIDNTISIYEGEDFNLDGEYDAPTSWSFRNDDIRRNIWSNNNWNEINPTSTDANSDGIPDGFSTDNDRVPDGYELFYGTMDPIYTPSGSLYLDPTDGTDDDDDPEPSMTLSEPGSMNPLDTWVLDPSSTNGKTAFAQQIKFSQGGVTSTSLKDITSIIIYAEPGVMNSVSFEILVADKDLDGVSSSNQPSRQVYYASSSVNTEDGRYQFNIPDNVWVDPGIPTDPESVPMYFFMVKSGSQNSPLEVSGSHYSSNPWTNWFGITSQPMMYSKQNGAWVLEVDSYIYYELILKGTSGSGDGLSNYEEYLIGLNPKNINSDCSDKATFSVDHIDPVTGNLLAGDHLSDGDEVGIHTDSTMDNLMIYTNVEDGAFISTNYGSSTSDYIEFDPDGPIGPKQGYRYDYAYTIDDPVYGVSSPTLSSNILLHDLADDSYISRTADSSKLFVISGVGFRPLRGEVVFSTPDYWPDYGTTLGGEAHVFVKSNSVDLSSKLLDGERNCWIFTSNPMSPDTDLDGLTDGSEIEPFADTDNDGIINKLDPDSDGDGVLDNDEQFFQQNLGILEPDDVHPQADNKGIPIPLDEYGNPIPIAINDDCDGDGLIDGLELLLGTEPLDPDTDGDGIVDGYVSDIGGKIYIWNPLTSTFMTVDSLQTYFNNNPQFGYSWTTAELDAIKSAISSNGLKGEIDISELKDLDSVTAMYVNIDQYMITDPLSTDTDNDGLWDGLDHYDSMTLTNLGERYIVNCPFSGGQRDVNNIPLFFSYERTYAVSCDPNLESTDEDDVTDFDEVSYGLGGLVTISVREFDYTQCVNDPEVSYEVTSNPRDSDTDDDGLLDHEEYIMIPGVDGSSLSVSLEMRSSSLIGSDPNNPDTDNDGLTDWDEVNTFSTNPKVGDTDDNSFPDGTKDYSGDGNVEIKDTDGDGVIDSCEVGEDVLVGLVDIESTEYDYDYDSDGLHNGDEIAIAFEYHWDSLSQPSSVTISYPFDDLVDILTHPDGHDYREITPTDVNGDLVLRSQWTYIDYDDDGLINTQDMDSDDDGIQDLFELEETLPYSSSLGNSKMLDEDTDGDGLFDGAEGIPSVLYYPGNPPVYTYRTGEYDHDNDGTDDPYDNDCWDDDVSDYSQIIVTFRTNVREIDWDDSTVSTVVYVAVPLTNKDITDSSYALEVFEEYGEPQESYPGITQLSIDAGIYTRNLRTPLGKFVYYKDSDIYVECESGLIQRFTPVETNPLGSTFISKNIEREYLKIQGEKWDDRILYGDDRDFDGQPNSYENQITGLFDDDPDSDDDGLPDGCALENAWTNSKYHGTMKDSDGDHLPDGFIDGWNFYFTDDGSNDDSLSESEETNGFWGMYDDVVDEDKMLYPSIQDLGTTYVSNGFDNWEGEDGDLSDYISSDETHPHLYDTDGDGLSDSEEILIGTDPNNKDTDGDMLPDGLELAKITDPETDPKKSVTIVWDPLNPSNTEDVTITPTYLVYTDPSDQVGETNEWAEAKLDPLRRDTDEDGLDDGIEVGMNPNSHFALRLQSDTSVYDHYLWDGIRTDPTNPDSDGDYIPDGWIERKVDEDSTEEYTMIPDGYYTRGSSYDVAGDQNPNFVDPWEGEAFIASGGMMVDPSLRARVTIDTDGDGIFDGYEAHGFVSATNDNLWYDFYTVDQAPKDAFGTWYSTSPWNADSDGDGLVDGKSMEKSKLGMFNIINTENRRSYFAYNQISSVIGNSFIEFKDSDNNDVAMLTGEFFDDGSNLYPDNMDTDGDGFIDGREVRGGIEKITNVNIDSDGQLSWVSSLISDEASTDSGDIITKDVRSLAYPGYVFVSETTADESWLGLGKELEKLSVEGEIHFAMDDEQEIEFEVSFDISVKDDDTIAYSRWEFDLGPISSNTETYSTTLTYTVTVSMVNDEIEVSYECINYDSSDDFRDDISFFFEDVTPVSGTAASNSNKVLKFKVENVDLSDLASENNDDGSNPDIIQATCTVTLTQNGIESIDYGTVTADSWYTTFISSINSFINGLYNLMLSLANNIMELLQKFVINPFLDAMMALVTEFAKIGLDLAVAITAYMIRGDDGILKDGLKGAVTGALTTFIKTFVKSIFDEIGVNFDAVKKLIGVYAFEALATTIEETFDNAMKLLGEKVAELLMKMLDIKEGDDLFKALKNNDEINGIFEEPDKAEGDSPGKKAKGMIVGIIKDVIKSLAIGFTKIKSTQDALFGGKSVIPDFSDQEHLLLHSSQGNPDDDGDEFKSIYKESDELMMTLYTELGSDNPSDWILDKIEFITDIIAEFYELLDTVFGDVDGSIVGGITEIIICLIIIFKELLIEPDAIFTTSDINGISIMVRGHDIRVGVSYFCVGTSLAGFFTSVEGLVKGIPQSMTPITIVLLVARVLISILSLAVVAFSILLYWIDLYDYYVGFSDYDKNGIIKREEEYTYIIKVKEKGSTEYKEKKLNDIKFNGPDTDGDGILDAEELYYNRKCRGEGSLSGWECPGPYQKAENDVDNKVYSELWPAWADFHDIDKYWEDSGATYRALDPTNPDTDGDGVWDGVEIKDGSHRWPDDESGLYNTDGSATNPLDGSDYNENEVRRL